MPVLKWSAQDRMYKTGLDRGVLYLPDGSAVPWNGLVEVNERSEDTTEPVFFDGAKVVDVVTLGSFSGSIASIGYPDELESIDGKKALRSGVYLAEQPKSKFALCWRSKVGDTVNGHDEDKYEIHIVYNVTAIPSDKVYATESDDPAIMEFEWEIVATPEPMEGYRPSAHMVIKTWELDPLLLRDIERIIYGSQSVDAHLIPMDEMVDFVNNWFRVQIIDNGDGTWTAKSNFNYIFIYGDDSFRIDFANAVYIDEYTYIISDTRDIKEVPQVKIVDNGDGTWTASSTNPNSIIVDGENFEIRDVEVEYLDQYTFRISEILP